MFPMFSCLLRGLKVGLDSLTFKRTAILGYEVNKNAQFSVHNYIYIIYGRASRSEHNRLGEKMRYLQARVYFGSNQYTYHHM